MKDVVSSGLACPASQIRLEVEAKDERAHDVFQAFDNDGSGVS